MNPTTHDTDLDDTEPTGLVGGRRPPTAFAERVRTAQGDVFRFFCPYCGRYHTHGAGEGHVVAHCIAEDSPLHETGYFLTEVETSPLPRVLKKIKYLRTGEIVSGWLRQVRP